MAPDNVIPLRTCRVCGVAKPAIAEFFYVHGPRMRTECKDCFRRLKNARYASNPEWAREVARLSYQKVDGAAAKRRARSSDPERYVAIAERYEAGHAEERHTKRVARHAANLERDREASRDWYYAHYDRARETTDRWRRKHPDEARAAIERVRVKRLAAPGDITPAQWGAVRRRFRGHCAYCGQPGRTFEMDHVIPLSRGGTTPSITSCRRASRVIARKAANSSTSGKPIVSAASCPSRQLQ